MRTISNVAEVPETEARNTGGSMDADLRHEGTAGLMDHVEKPAAEPTLPDHGPMSGPIGSVDMFAPGMSPGTEQQSADLPLDEEGSSYEEHNEVGAVPALGK